MKDNSESENHDWLSAPEPEMGDITLFGWVMVIVRGIPMGIVVFGGLLVLWVLRLIERPLFDRPRPFTPYLTQIVCRTSLMIMGIGFKVHGRPMQHKGAIVANHGAWLDIFVLNASQRVYFVSKSEVAGWPGIGWLARATGTVFIKRDPKEAKVQKRIFEERLMENHRLLFFPEGTSTDSLRVLPFKTTLFAAFFDPEIVHDMYIQPVSVNYFAPNGIDPRFYGWWGDMEFGTHLLYTLARLRQGRVDVVYHPPRKVDDYTSRKALAADLEADVRRGHAFDGRY
jgi:1-acyl-sn-glycerol-3-phosphate acyltransferase